MRLLPVFAVIILLAACTAPVPCHVQAKDYIDMIDYDTMGWTSAQIGAGSVFILGSVGGRASQDLLMFHLTNLQKVRQRVATVTVPQCAQAAQAAQLAYMDASIADYQVYIDGGSSDAMTPGTDKVDELLQVATQKLAELKAN